MTYDIRIFWGFVLGISYLKRSGGVYPRLTGGADGGGAETRPYDLVYRCLMEKNAPGVCTISKLFPDD